MVSGSRHGSPTRLIQCGVACRGAGAPVINARTVPDTHLSRLVWPPASGVLGDTPGLALKILGAVLVLVAGAAAASLMGWT